MNEISFTVHLGFLFVLLYAHIYVAGGAAHDTFYLVVSSDVKMFEFPLLLNEALSSIHIQISLSQLNPN